MFKRLWVLFFTSLMLLTLVGCTGGSYTITYGGVHAEQNALIGEYKSFSGYYYKEIKLEKGKNLTIKFETQTEKGELIAKVLDSNEKIIKTMKTGDTFTLSVPGKYKLLVEGEKHKGSFILSW